MTQIEAQVKSKAQVREIAREIATGRPAAADVADATLTTFAIKSFGCQMNVYDAERMGEQLIQGGLREVSGQADADVIILNTCHIREKAVEKVYSDLGRLRELKQTRADAGHATLIAVAGCVAQAEGSLIIERAPTVDIVVGPQSLHRLPDLIARRQALGKSVVDTDFAQTEKFTVLPERRQRSRVSAFLTIQEGCDRFCTFCVVPYTRGAEISRSLNQIDDEARTLVAQGVREITLLGQNVNAFHGLDSQGQPATLAKLVTRLAAIEGLERIRYTTSHPRDMSDDLIEVHASEPKLMPYLHLPVQSGSDRILGAMNRKHTAADYLAIIAKVRQARPDIAISTDFIVGFPGESEADFEATLKLAGDVGFAQAYTFKYSPRPGTPASNLDEQVSEAVKSERLGRLQVALEAQGLAFNQACVGRTLPVMFDRTAKRNGFLTGRTPYLQTVSVELDRSWLGRTADVQVTAASAYTLAGEVVGV